MKKAALSVCFSVLVWTVALAADAPVSPSTTRNTPAPDHSTADENVKLLESFSEKVIASSDRTLEQVKWIFVVSTGLASAMLGAAAWLGYREVKVAARKAHQEAKRLATEAVQSELASLREVVVIAKEIAVWTLRAIRYITIAMQHTPPEAFSVHEAQVAIREVQDQANNLRELKFEDVRLEAWTLSMEAYCFAALGSFEEAIAKQKEAIKIGPQQLATNYLNLGCYLARKREFTEAAQALLTAYATGGAAMKDKAKGDPDLAEMRKQPVYKELFTG